MVEPEIVGVATYRVEAAPARLMCIGLGSCLGIALHHPGSGFGAMAHAMLPAYEKGRSRVRPARYVDSSIRLMVEGLERRCGGGGEGRGLVAYVAGGAQMFPSLDSDIMNIGRQNIESARRVLGQYRIPVRVEEVGGHRGRTLIFDIATGMVTVRKVGM